MVKIFTSKDHAMIKHVLQEANKETDAEIALVVARASDKYSEIGLTCGFIIGTAAALLLSRYTLVSTIMLIQIQFFTALLFLVVPFLWRLCLRLFPAQLTLRAAQRAAVEYTHLMHQLPAGVPALLIYVSLAERYVHIYSSRSIREKIADKEWDAVVETLIAGMKNHNASTAIISAVSHAAQMLKKSFPPTGRKHNTNDFTELKD